MSNMTAKRNRIKIAKSLGFLEDIEDMDPRDRWGLSIEMHLSNIEDVTGDGRAR